MGKVLRLVKSFVAKTVRLFSGCSSTQESTTYLSPSNSLPTPIIGSNLPSKRYSEEVRRLRPLFPPNCPSLEMSEVNVVGDYPIDAGGYADIWEATLIPDGRDIIQKSYRFMETGDMDSLFRVRIVCSSRIPWLMLRSRDIAKRF